VTVDVTMRPADIVLVGPASIDRYLRADGGPPELVPGGGALNVAHHWSRAGLPFTFVTRVGDDQPAVFTDFLHRHAITHGDIVTPGVSASIDIVMREDRQPWMDHFVEGVWSGFRLDDAEAALVSGARCVHAVMVDVVLAEFERLGALGAFDGVEVSADYLSFRHVDLDRFARTLSVVDLAFVGWPGEVDDPVVRGLVGRVRDAGRRAVVTFGARGVLVVDADGERWVPVDAVEVTGTTVGCGDAFIAAFLATLWSDGSASPALTNAWGNRLDAALDAARAAGALATTWLRPLPADAYARDGEPRVQPAGLGR
jgi:sugar/nucleoside kinase (ribokinase family)